jgi:hypothetical protein
MLLVIAEIKSHLAMWGRASTCGFLCQQIDHKSAAMKEKPFEAGELTMTNGDGGCQGSSRRMK